MNTISAFQSSIARLALLICLWFLCQPLSAQTLRICCYNVLDGPVSAADDQNFRVVIEQIGNQTVMGTARQIDILAFQEGPQSVFQYDDIEDNFEAVFGGTYDSSISAADAFGCRTGFIFNTGTVQLIAATTLGSGLTHNSRRAQFRPVGGTSADDFIMYSIHLRAGTFDPADAAERAMEANVFRANAATLPPTSQIIYCGDFNIAGSDELAYQNLFAGNATGSARETLNTPFGFRENTNWQENIAFHPFHTQNPVNNMDDRFDAFYINDNMMDGENFEYVKGSCRVLGNNSTHNLNQSINTGTGTAGFGTELVATSDHLPVFCDFKWGQTAENFDQSISIDAVSTNYVRPGGPVGGADGTNNMEIEGSSNGAFAGFGVVDFDLSGQIKSGLGIAATDNIALTLIQDNEFFTDSGPFSVYLASDAAAKLPIDGSIQYQTGQNGIDSVPAVLATGAIKIATYAGVHDNGATLLPDGTTDNVSLFGSEIQSGIIDALVSNGNLRLLLVPDHPGAAVTFTGFASALGSPSLSADILTDDGTIDVLPNSISISNGKQGNGIIGATDESDDSRIEYFAAPVTDSQQPNVQLIFNGTLPVSDPQSLTVVIEARANSANLQLIVEQFNFATSTWDVVDSADAELSDATYSLTVKGNLSDYVGGGNLILTRAGWIPNGPVFMFPWRVDVDLFNWSIQE